MNSSFYARAELAGRETRKRSGSFVSCLSILGLILGLAGCGGGGSGAAGVGAVVVLTQRDFNAVVNALAGVPGALGDLFVAGAFSTYNGVLANNIVRLNADGTIDPTFDSLAGFDAAVTTLTPATDGSGDIYVAGPFTMYRGAAVNRLVRLNSDGSVDAGFDTGTGFGSLSGTPEIAAVAIAADGSGDVYVGGIFDSYDGVASAEILRLNSDGTRDGAFVTGTGFTGVGRLGVTDIAVATNATGDIYVVGNFATYRGAQSNFIVRIESDGSRDALFTTGAGFDAVAQVVLATTDGSGDVYVGGDFTSYRSVNSFRLIRINNNGSRDVGFVTGTGFDASVDALQVASDASGDIYVGGQFLTYNAVAASRIARLDSGGTLDTGFAFGAGLDGSVTALLNESSIPATGDIYIGGDFMLYDSSGVLSLVRVNSDGARE